MGVPVYSIFRGTIGAVDRYLVNEGRLTLIECAEDVKTKIKAVRREKSVQHEATKSNPSLETIVRYIATIAALKPGDTAKFAPVVEQKEEEEVPVGAHVSGRN